LWVIQLFLPAASLPPANNRKTRGVAAPLEVLFEFVSPALERQTALDPVSRWVEQIERLSFQME